MRLYLRLPSSSAAEMATSTGDVCCRYALVAAGKVEREGVAALSELSATLSKVERVTLFLAASDVVLLRLNIPPLSSSRLKAALPNLVEDHLLGDPAECAIVAGGTSADGVRTVAIVQRAWLETIARAVLDNGVRSMAIMPAQLCLSCTPGTISVAVDARPDEIQVTVRLSDQEGFGVAMSPGSSARDVLETVSAVARDAPLAIYVPGPLVSVYQDAVDALSLPATVLPEDVSCWLDGMERADLDLLSGSNVGHDGQDRAWRQWRWPLALAAAVLMVNLTGLYADWWRLKSESDALRARMVQTFRSAYPNESVILDPLAQMKLKIAASRRASGEPAADDFPVLLAGFADAWARAVPSGPDRKPLELAAVEFRDHSLLVRTQRDAELPEDKLAEALRAHGLSLSRANAGTWQMRSIR